MLRFRDDIRVIDFLYLAWEVFTRPRQLRDWRANAGLGKTLSIWHMSPAASSVVLKQTIYVRVLMILLLAAWAPCIFVISQELQPQLAGYAVAGVTLGLIFSFLRCIVYAFGENIAFAYLHILSYVAYSVTLGFRVYSGSESVLAAIFIVLVGVLLGVVLGFMSAVMGTLSDVLVVVLAAFPLAGTSALSIPERIATVLLFLLCYTITYFRIPSLFIESVFSTWLHLRASATSKYDQALSWLPLVKHDLIYVELPFLKSLLMGIGINLPQEDAQRLIELGSKSIGQKTATRLAISELQVYNLERAATEALTLKDKKKRAVHFNKLVALKLPFLSAESRGSIGDLLEPLQEMGKGLRTATTTRNHLSRERALRDADKELKQAEECLMQRRKTSDRNLRHALGAWGRVLQQERDFLNQDKKNNPQIPIPFVAGAVLSGEKDKGLFRGRGELISIIENDLVGGRRGPILLIGQRRIGKSSLLKMLPYYIPTLIVSIDFQGLSGSKYLKNPHRWIAKEVAIACPEVSEPPISRTWDDTFSWLKGVDNSLKGDDRHLLITIDEVERLQDEIENGRSSTDLLDLLRASDSFGNIRFLLATAYAPYRLGKYWSDRLINAQLRHLEPLSPEEAESLITKPMQGFPDIYPKGGAARIVEATGGHPFLVQLVCDKLCRSLNQQGRLAAIMKDVEAAIDQADNETALFDELWAKFNGPEREVLKQIASNLAIEEEQWELFRLLEREKYLRSSPQGLGFAVPMFKDWVVMNA